ncbi:MAG: hypothetical protein ACF788_00740, partial [Novipirellula sp. JB048]
MSATTGDKRSNGVEPVSSEPPSRPFIATAQPSAAAERGGIDVWDHFLQTSRPDIGYKQFSWWAELLASRNWGHFVVLVHDRAGELVGGARVYIRYFAEGRCYYHIPEGPVLPAEPKAAAQVFAALMEQIDAHRKADPCRVSHLRVEPRWLTQPAFMSSFRPTKRCNEPRDTLCIDLRLDPDEILRQMKPKGRYNVRLAAR